jgi:hypothetical protein
VVALERLFAATSRGAALMDRIKADRGLADVEIRIIARDGSYTRVSARRTSASAAGPPSATSGTEDAETSSAPAVNLDHTGTRRAPRFRMSDGTEAQVDGALAALVDLSSIGAQISSPASLKPAQVVRMMLADDLGMVRFSASVAWVSFEIPKGVSRYRAGVEFKGAETKAVEAFCARHKVRNVI